ncbi:hypothetical protein [Bdellovibrio reynosensis]|uniref:Uncharacterized protein n=1 Tax=Bdellovibrio reynosensis TaxID=2835041 RepID=A0ABY4CED3_9BACT|nr:hypothetical protein [Bdellovibrio reynosensis]UOF01903.1 hypothetical protein MNR06_02910 [Bdellovibrio reynosensis]
MKKIILSLLFVSATSVAHEGHDHGPGAIQAPKGGVVRSLETINLELLSGEKNVQIYVYGTDMTAAKVKDYPASLTVALPKKKAEHVKLTDAGDHWTAEIDPKNAHRYTLELSIKQGGHDDKVKWVVEPKKKK